MSRPSVIRHGGDRLRVGPWRGDRHVALVSPGGAPRPVGGEVVRRALDHLAAQGFSEAITSALSPPEQPAFIDAGFEVREHLHLLRHGLDPRPRGPSVPLRRARRGDRADVVAVDQSAFPEFWQLDEDGIADAIHATPRARFRVAEVGHRIVGYAITGRAGQRAYLQRLAVHPQCQGRGLGRALTVDSIDWAARKGAAELVVNTQDANDAALALYEALGFVRQRNGLAVLGRSLVGAA